MDIVIHNGVIQQKEKESVNKMEEDEIKLDYTNYDENISGPYYDRLECHIHIYRKAKMIPNFYGPQDQKLIKINKSSKEKNSCSWNDKQSFCTICHQLQINKFAFLSNKRILHEDDFHIPKNTKTKTQILEEEQTLYKKLNNLKINNNKSLKNIIIKYYKINESKNIDCAINYLYESAYLFNSNKQNIYKNFENIVFKLIFKPIYYTVSNTETKILWNKNLTRYQKFKLSIPNYKDSCIFNKEHSINSKYIVIE
jgi:hypothetical protein